MARITHCRDIDGGGAGLARGQAPWRSAVRARRFAVMLAVAALGGCTIPRSGPELSIPAQPPSGFRYCLVDVDAVTLPRLERPAPLPAGTPPGRGSASGRLGPGDVVRVTVFEAAAGGLFIPLQAGSRPGNFVEMPQQTVDAQGMLTVPYAGPIKAAGLTVSELQDVIVAALRPKSIEPQVVVSVIDRKASEVSVLGQVNTPTRFSLGTAPARILDAIARAGGPKGDAFDTLVTLQRQGQTTTTSLNVLINRPSANVPVWPGDTIYVARRQRAYNVIGPSGAAGRFSIDTPTLSVADALARAGGIGGPGTGPSLVYLYRFDGVTAKGAEPPRAIVYRFDMRNALGFFYAGKALVRDGDLLYVAPVATGASVRIADIWRVVSSGEAPRESAAPAGLQLCSQVGG